MRAPIETRLRANGIEHHVLTWNDSATETIVLCHGFLDMAFSFAPLAEQLVDHGCRVVAFDFRGHGETEWVGRGGYYHFADYVLDMAELMPQLSTAPPHLLGHSMGGTACAMFAGARPGAVRSLTLVEGLGPPAQSPTHTADRLVAFLDSVARVRGAAGRPMPTLEDAVARMRVQNPDLPDTLAHFLASKATHAVPGGLAWRFDPIHRTTSPTPFVVEAFLSVARRITAPMLVVAGQRGFRLPDEAERRAALGPHTFVEIPKVGHMIHWLAPQQLAQAVAEFCTSAGTGSD